MKDISVIIPIYNSRIDDILVTLESIVKQNGITYEIILCDDGSSNNQESEIKNFFLVEKDVEYNLILNKKNKGTVQNVISALERARGEFIKIIAPGDMLYKENTLANMVDFMRTGGIEFAFGRMYAYSGEHGNQQELRDFHAPKDLKAYQSVDLKRIKKNIVLYCDLISGASMFAKCDSFLKELKYISKYVKYCEDYVQISLALRGITFSLYDDIVVCYECTQGISNQKYLDRKQSKVQIDYENLIKNLATQYADFLLQKRLKLNIYRDIENPMKRILKKFLCSPGFYIFSIKTKRL